MPKQSSKVIATFMMTFLVITSRGYLTKSISDFHVDCSNDYIVHTLLHQVEGKPSRFQFYSEQKKDLIFSGKMNSRIWTNIYKWWKAKSRFSHRNRIISAVFLIACSFHLISILLLPNRMKNLIDFSFTRRPSPYISPTWISFDR